MNTTTERLIKEGSNEAQDNENMLFCKSLVPILDRLNPRESALAKMEIQKVLFNIEFRD